MTSFLHQILPCYFHVANELRENFLRGRFIIRRSIIIFIICIIFTMRATFGFTFIIRRSIIIFMFFTMRTTFGFTFIIRRIIIIFMFFTMRTTFGFTFIIRRIIIIFMFFTMRTTFFEMILRRKITFFIFGVSYFLKCSIILILFISRLSKMPRDD